MLPLTGDDAYTRSTLPFPVTLYGQTYSTGWVDSNGLVTFVDPGERLLDAWPIPSAGHPEEPNAALYPFWHDWVVDGSASVRTATPRHRTEPAVRHRVAQRSLLRGPATPGSPSR